MSEINEKIIDRLSSDPDLKELIRKKERFSASMASIMMLIYFGFILMIAFAPELLGETIEKGGVVTWGIPLGIGIILVAFLLTGLYVALLNEKFDLINAKIIKKAKSGK